LTLASHIECPNGIGKTIDEVGGINIECWRLDESGVLERGLGEEALVLAFLAHKV
jgi:hypothetical protein